MILMCIWIQFSSFLLRIFSFTFTKEITLQFLFLTVFISGVGLETVTLTYILWIYLHTCAYILHIYTYYMYIYVCIHMYIYYSESYWFCCWHFAISVKAWKQQCGLVTHPQCGQMAKFLVTYQRIRRRPGAFTCHFGKTKCLILFVYVFPLYLQPAALLVVCLCATQMFLSPYTACFNFEDALGSICLHVRLVLPSPNTFLCCVNNLQLPLRSGAHETFTAVSFFFSLFALVNMVFR